MHLNDWHAITLQNFNDEEVHLSLNEGQLPYFHSLQLILYTSTLVSAVLSLPMYMQVHLLPLTRDCPSPFPRDFGAGI